MERYVGVMSGTSLDGIDLVLVALAPPPAPFQPRILASRCLPFSRDVRDGLLALLRATLVAPAEVLAAHVVLGRMFGEAVRDFLADSAIDPATVTAVGMHGLTLFHLPEGASALGAVGRGTWQIGDAAAAHQACGIPIVANLRGADMAAGGQGAPLVPFLDQLLFGHPSETRVLLNLGGIANLTLLRHGQPVIAFDSGPANMIVDLLMERHPKEPGACDPQGRHAAAGKLLPDLLAACLGHPYFALAPPKSTGRELFGQAFVDRYFSLEANYDDLVHTATRLTARTVADAIRAVAGPLAAGMRLICAGGGVHNATLMAMLREELDPMRVGTTAEEGLDPDSKEALLMAALAWARIHHLPGNLPEVTGAKAHVVLGELTA